MALIYGPPAADDLRHGIEQDEVFVLPASRGQERLWFLDKLEPDSAVYNMSTALRLRGDINPRILEQIFLELSARHETLRTTFAVENDHPVQVIAAKPRVMLERVCLEGLRPDEQAAAVRRLGVELARRPFDLVQGPLWRIALAQLSEYEHVLFLVFHHSICDGWSFGVLFREFAALYEAFRDDRPSPLPDLSIQYADYVHWQNEWLAGETVQGRLTYWQQHLVGAPSLLSLPTDHPRPLTQRYRGASLPVRVPADIVSELRAFSMRQGVTLFMTLLAGWQAMLARYSGQDDIVVGVPYANRTQVETEGLIGFFVNTLALRTDLSGDPSFIELAHRVRETALGAYAHQDVPFEKVVEVVQPERNLGFSPIFQTQLSFQNTAPAAMRLPGLVVEPLEIDNGTAQFDLSLVLDELDGGLAGQLEYNTDLFEQDTMTRMIGRLQVLLAAAAANPEQRISSLPLLTEAERHVQLVTWNATEAEFPAEARVHELFEAQAARTPDAPAVVFQDRQLSYRQLNDQANRIAHHLRRKGVGRGDLVGLCLDRSLEMVLGVLAVLKAGAAYVPLDPAYPRERLAFMLEDAALTLVITQAAVRDALPFGTASLLVLDDQRETLKQESSANLDTQGSAEDVAYVIYTSGSTGKPKGVVIGHRALVNFLWTMRQSPGLQATDTLVAVTSLSFDIAGLEILLPLVTGARVVVADRETVSDGWRLAALLRQCGATVMQATPAGWRMLLTANWTGQPGLVMLCGGEALAPDLARALLQCGSELWNLYGPTETTIWSTIYRVSAEDERVSIGRPIGNTQVYVLDRMSRPVPIGVAGELYIGGMGVAQGYLRRPELTAERFVTPALGVGGAGRLYRTGDLVRRLADGNLEYLGRLDQQVKVRGHRIELGEIEATLRDLPGVRDAAVAPQEDASGETRLVAYVVPRHGHEATSSDMQWAVRERLPDYMVPAAWVILDALPLTPNGKLDRRALPAPRRRPQGKPRIGHARPLSTIHHQLIQIWEELLDVQPIGITDSFFELGGHSLLAARMIERVERACGKRIPLATLFGEPTIEHLATVLLRQEGDAQEPKIIALQPAGTKRPFFFLHGDWEGGGFYTVAIARQLGTEQPFYVVSPHGVGGNKRVPRTIEAMATAHLKEIRAVQPRGPYILGGFCTDGLVAFEMAQQLLAQGEQVDLLVLLDSAPELRRQRIRRVIEGVGYLAGLDSDTKLDFYLRLCAYDARRQAFQLLEHEEQLRTALNTIRSTVKRMAFRFVGNGGAKGARDKNQQPSSRDLNGIYRWVTAAYKPRRYPGHVAHFWAAEEYSSHKKGLHKEWRALAPDAEFHTIPGAHLTFLTIHGDNLAEEIAWCVATAQGE